jgi:hypothetical protein
MTSALPRKRERAGKRTPGEHSVTLGIVINRAQQSKTWMAGTIRP